LRRAILTERTKAHDLAGLVWADFNRQQRSEATSADRPALPGPPEPTVLPIPAHLKGAAR
jgi:hypothetical protein